MRLDRQVLILYAATRLVVGAVILVAARWVQQPNGALGGSVGYREMATVWDGRWYAGIATDGYPLPLPVDSTGRAVESAWAFSPLFPWLARAVMATGLEFAAAAVLVNLLAGAVAAVVIGRLLRHAGVGPRTIALTVTIWLLAPPTATLQIAYSEAVAAALLFGVFLAMARRRYAAGSVLVLVLGLTRPVALPLLAVVGVHAWCRWRERRGGGVPDRGEPVSAVRLGVLVASTAAAAVAWPVLVGIATGRPTAFIEVQRAWGQRPDQPFVAWLRWAFDHGGIAGVVLFVSALVVICVVPARTSWLGMELRTWAVVYPPYLVGTTAAYPSLIRFLLLDVPLFAVLGGWLETAVSAARRRWPGIPVAVAAAPIGAAMVWGVWWWTSVVLVFDPPADWPP